jgi:hypothetical protein
MKDESANPATPETAGGQPASIRYLDWDDDKVTDVKLQVNNMIWMHSPDSLTLQEAEDRACEILNLLRQEPTR